MRPPTSRVRSVCRRSSRVRPWLAQYPHLGRVDPPRSRPVRASPPPPRCLKRPMSTRLSPTGRYPGPGGFGDAIPMRRPGGARRRGWAGFLARLLAGERPEIAGALCVAAIFALAYYAVFGAPGRASSSAYGAINTLSGSVSPVSTFKPAKEIKWQAVQRVRALQGGRHDRARHRQRGLRRLPHLRRPEGGGRGRPRPGQRQRLLPRLPQARQAFKARADGRHDPGGGPERRARGSQSPGRVQVHARPAPRRASRACDTR